MSRRAADSDGLFPAATTAADVARIVGGRVDGRADLPLTGAAGFEDAAADQLTLIADASHAAVWGDVQSGAALISEGLRATGHDTGARALVVVPDARLAMAAVLQRLAPPPFAPPMGVDPSAFVDAAAVLGDAVSIGPRVTIGPGCHVGDGVVLHAGVCLAADVTVGADSTFYANVSVRERSEIGRRVILHAGVVIGSDGFGYRPGPEGLVKMPHVGGVVIEDEVEIGANSCVDRAMFGVTRIGAGSKLDNLVQIGHNCRIGRDCVIAGLTGVSGSVTIGDGTRIGGAAGVADHVTIGAGASVAAYSAVMNDLPDGEAWGGVPAGPLRQKMREVVALRKLPAVLKGLSRSEAGPRGAHPATETSE